MQRENGNLHRKSRKEAQEQEELLGRIERDPAGSDTVRQFHVIERIRLAVEIQDRAQHEHGTEKRVNEELNSGRAAFCAAPSTNHQVHRYKRDFPEYVKDEQIDRGENANESELKQKQERVKVF